MFDLAPIFAPWDGNAEALAAAIGEKGVTVRAWRTRGRIPSRYWVKITSAAAARGWTLNLRDFLPGDDHGAKDVPERAGQSPGAEVKPAPTTGVC